MTRDGRSGAPMASKTVTVTVPLRFVERGGRKTVISPVPYAAPPPKFDNALIKALARAHRWRRMIEQGQYVSITELAKTEKVNQSYACRLLRLTLLAPNLVEIILDGKQGPSISLKTLIGGLSTVWSEQRKAFDSLTAD